jgi:hypothetical protein
MKFDWSGATQTLEEFGGSRITLHVPKTGLPYFDALRLYGAIDLYIGLREDVCMRDAGTEWCAEGRSRVDRLIGRDERVFKLIRKSNLKPKPERNVKEGDYCKALRSRLVSGEESHAFRDSLHEANGPFAGFDSAIQSGIRGLAAASYSTLQSGQSSNKTCIAHIPLSGGLIAFAGYKRTETVGDISFLPIFEGRVDLSKVVSPLRAWLASPNALCAQALMILGLRACLFIEGFQDRLTAVVYNKRVKQGDFAYSGAISIGSTAVGRITSSSFATHTYRVFRQLVAASWQRNKATDLASHAIAMAHWLMQPTAKNLSTVITSQEMLNAKGKRWLQILTRPEYVEEVCTMTYGECPADAENIHNFARAIARAIYCARMAGTDNPSKRWYDEVATLRSAPNDKAFFNRALNLLELGHRENTFVGTEDLHRYDPRDLMKSAGCDFETFRDLFRMYLIQESRPPERVADSSSPSSVSAPEEASAESAEAVREEEDGQ